MLADTFIPKNNSLIFVMCRVVYFLIYILLKSTGCCVRFIHNMLQGTLQHAFSWKNCVISTN